LVEIFFESDTIYVKWGRRGNMKIRVKSKSKSDKPSKKVKDKKPAKKTVKKTVSKKTTAKKTTAKKEVKKTEKKAVKKPAAKKTVATKKIITSKKKAEEAAKKEPKKIALPAKKITGVPQRTLKKIEKSPVPAVIITAKKTLSMEYGENRVTLMIVDPWKLFAYWEITEHTAAKTRGELALRVYDVTGIYFDGANANIVFDIPAKGRIGDSYIGVAPGKSFIVDLGVISKGKDFVMIARSNQVTTPGMKVAKEEGALPEEIYEVGPVTGYA